MNSPGRFPDLTYASPDRRPRSPEANEALLLIYPEERATLRDLLDEHDEVQAVERQHPGLGEGEYWYIRCEDEWVARGLERAWAAYRLFRRTLINSTQKGLTARSRYPAAQSAEQPGGDPGC